MSFTLCSIHILFISNEFYKFWMSFDFRSRCTKNGQIWAKTQPNRPGTPEDKVPVLIQWQYDTIIMPWVEDWVSVWSNGSKGLHKEQWTHNSVPTWVYDSDPPPWQDHKCAEGTSAQQRAEMGQRKAGRPTTATVQAALRTPTSGSNQGCSCKGGGQMATPPGRPA